MSPIRYNKNSEGKKKDIITWREEIITRLLKAESADNLNIVDAASFLQKPVSLSFVNLFSSECKRNIYFLHLTTIYSALRNFNSVSNTLAM